MFSTCAFAGVWNFPALWLFHADWTKDLLANVIAASAILAAYLLTAATILPAIEEKTIIQRLRDWKYYDQIVNYIGRAAKGVTFLLTLSLVAIPLPKVIQVTTSLNPYLSRIDQIFSAFWWAIFVLSVGFVYVATRILLKLLRAR
jgi:membrane protease YdiL (CAAX protease family)